MPESNKNSSFKSEKTIDLESLRETSQQTPGTGVSRFPGAVPANQPEPGEEIRYRLVFILDCAQTDGKKNWILAPAIQHMKMTGEPGNVSAFDATVPLPRSGHLQETILHRLLETPACRDKFHHYYSFFIGDSSLVLFLKASDRLSAVRFSQADRFNIRFLYSSFDPGTHNPLFRPFLEAVCGEERHAFTPGGDSAVFTSPFTVIVFGHSGTAYYRIDSPVCYEVLNWFSSADRQLTDPEINGLQTYIKKEKALDITVAFDLKTIRIVYPVPVPVLELDRKDTFLMAVLRFKYGQGETEFDSSLKESEPLILEDNRFEITAAERSLDYEKKVFNDIMNGILAPVVKTPYFNGAMIDSQLDFFIARYGKALMDGGVEIRLRKDGRKVIPGQPQVFFAASSGIDWFTISPGITNSDGSREEVEIDEEALECGLVRSKSGYHILSRTDIDNFQLLLKTGRMEEGSLRISRSNFILLDRLKDAISEKDDGVDRAIETARMLLSGKSDSLQPLPEKLHGELRDYQKAGFSWLMNLRHLHLNGCLADDMGLGKTVQVLAFLQSLKEQGVLGKVLLISPVTALYNWMDEISKFTPALTRVLHSGPARSQGKGDLSGNDIVIVSYHTLRKDLDLFLAYNPDILILDEAQTVKNYWTEMYKAVKSIPAAMKISLTGTPVENNTLELWSQMDLLNPGLLGGLGSFKENFQRPIQSGKDPAAVERLRLLVSPFLLRRRKKDVLKDLPPKEEITVYSKMDSRQAGIYEDYRVFFKDRVEDSLDRLGPDRSGIEVFTALLKLRQTVLIPSMADKKWTDVSSCKFDQLTEMISEAVEEGHKIVLFSQFLEPLDRASAWLTEHSLGWARIDGSIPVTERKTEIDRFQNDPGIPVFLVSLRTGGAGINLIAADYVILFDPWWNPAVENQAMDRTHRIGQKKPVTVYRMIVKDSVEERMMELQARKRELVDSLITSDSGVLKTLDRETILALFS